MTSKTDEIVMYLLIRADLRMSKGKIATQAGHAVQLAMRAAERSGEDRKLWLHDWESNSYPKITLRVDSLAHLDALCYRMSQGQVVFARVIDEGRTEIPAGSLTAVGLQPMPRSLALRWVGTLKPL